jgi:hypothetical protein
MKNTKILILACFFIFLNFYLSGDSNDVDLKTLVGKTVKARYVTQLGGSGYKVGIVAKIEEDKFCLKWNKKKWVKPIIIKLKEEGSTWICNEKMTGFAFKMKLSCTSISKELHQVYILEEGKEEVLVYEGNPTYLTKFVTLPKSNVKYEIKGTASFVSVTFRLYGDETRQEAKVRVPWTYSFTAKSGDFLYISAQNLGKEGNLEVIIYKDGFLYKRGAARGAFTIASASGTY